MSFGCFVSFRSFSISVTRPLIFRFASILIAQRTAHRDTFTMHSTIHSENKNDNKTKSAVTKRRTSKMKQKKSKNVIVLVHGSLIAMPCHCCMVCVRFFFSLPALSAEQLDCFAQYSMLHHVFVCCAHSYSSSFSFSSNRRRRCHCYCCVGVLCCRLFLC